MITLIPFPDQDELSTLTSADRRLLLQQWFQRLSNVHLTPPGDDPATPRGDSYDSVLRREFEDAPEQSDVVTVAAIGWSECLHPGVDNGVISQRLGAFLRCNWDNTF